MNLTVTEIRTYQTIDLDNPRCLACGAAMSPEFPLVCPDPDCRAGYFNDGLPVMEDWPEHLMTDPDIENPVPVIVCLNNGATWDWCDEHREYEEDHPLGQRSCRYYAAEARMLTEAAEHYRDNPPTAADPAYYEMRERMRRNPQFTEERHTA